MLEPCEFFAIRSRLRCVSWGCCCIEGCRALVQSRAASGDSSGGGKISRFGLCFCGSSGFRGDPWIREPQSAQDGVDTSRVSSGGFGGAVCFTVVELGVDPQTALTKAVEVLLSSSRLIQKDSTGQSLCNSDCTVFSHVGGAVVRTLPAHASMWERYFRRNSTISGWVKPSWGPLQFGRARCALLRCLR